jgi:hypothetical protein
VKGVCKKPLRLSIEGVDRDGAAAEPLIEDRSFKVVNHEVWPKVDEEDSGTALSISETASVATSIDSYLKNGDIEIRPSHEVDHLGGVMSLIPSTGGIALLPPYAKTFLAGSVTTRPLQGVGPRIDLSAGYRKASPSSDLKLFLSKIDALAIGVLWACCIGVSFGDVCAGHFDRRGERGFLRMKLKSL